MATSSKELGYDLLFKLILIGDSGVGKTNLLLRYTRNQFQFSTRATIGVGFFDRQITIDGKKLKIQVWDTAGQEIFKAVIPQLYRGSHGIFVVFDLTRPDTFTNIKKWIEQVHQHTSSDLPIILIGNKSDLVEQRAITTQTASTLARQLKISYMETSALNALNVEEAFTSLVNTIYQKEKLKFVANLSDTPPVDTGGRIRIDLPSDPPTNTPQAPKSSGCC